MRSILFGFIFCLTIGLAGAKAEDDNVFTLPLLGFSITKPAHWKVAGAEDHVNNLNTVKLEDSDFQEKIKKYATVPLYACMKYQEPYEDINPGVKIQYLLRDALPAYAGKEPKEILDTITINFRQIFKDFKLLEGPLEAEISAIKSGYMKYQYTLTVANGRSFPNCSEMWVIPRGEYFYLVVAGYRQDAVAEDREEIKQIISSIKIAQ